MLNLNYVSCETEGAGFLYEFCSTMRSKTESRMDNLNVHNCVIPNLSQVAHNLRYVCNVLTEDRRCHITSTVEYRAIIKLITYRAVWNTPRVAIRTVEELLSLLQGRSITKEMVIVNSFADPPLP